MDKILAAAEQVFAERGFEGSRTREIATLAGVNVSTLHYHYRSKEELYAAVLRAVFSEVREKIAAASAAPTAEPGVRLRRFVEAHFDAVAARPHFPRLMFDALIHAPAAVREVVRDTVRPIIELLLPHLVEGIHGGRLRETLDVRHVVLSAVAMNSIYFIAAPMVEELFGPEAYGEEGRRARREAVIDLLFHGLFRKEALP